MPKLKLTDADRVILASAGAREAGLVLPVPKSLKLSPTERVPVLRRLLAKGLLVERLSLPDEQPWVRAEDGTRTSLVIAPAGLEAVGLGSDDGIRAPAAIDDAAPRPRGKAGAKQSSPKRASKAKAKPEPKPTAPAPVGRVTKLDLLVGALRQRKGATIAELMEATGWQAHSIRGSISGALKKRMSLNVTSKTVDGRGRVYRIEAGTTK
jgi:hypothetical protein